MNLTPFPSFHWYSLRKRHAHHHRKRKGGKSPEAIAGSIFRLLDEERRGCISYEMLEEFLRHVFTTIPLEVVLTSFAEDTLSRLKYEGDKMFKEVSSSRRLCSSSVRHCCLVLSPITSV